MSWSGCGAHVEQVLAGVPADARCPGHPREGGLLKRLLRRG